MSANLLSLEGLSDMTERVEIVVHQPDRREDAAHILGGLRKDVKAFEKTFTKSGRQLNKLYRNHSASRDESLAILSALNSDWAARQQHVLDGWFELRETLTEEEWNALFGEQ